MSQRILIALVVAVGAFVLWRILRGGVAMAAPMSGSMPPWTVRNAPTRPLPAIVTTYNASVPSGQQPGAPAGSTPPPPLPWVTGTLAAVQRAWAAGSRDPQ